LAGHLSTHIALCSATSHQHHATFANLLTCCPAILLSCPAGTRHPFLAKYKVGFTQQGKVTALEVDLYNNAGRRHMRMLMLAEFTPICAPEDKTAS
jgi:hypothetical protein